MKVGEHIYLVLRDGVDRLPNGFAPQTFGEFAEWQASKGVDLKWFEVVHLDTVLYSWAVMLLLLFAGQALARSLRTAPDARQTVVEELVGFARGIVRNFIGQDVGPYLWYIGSIFMFILTSNWLGILPWKFLHFGPLESLHLPHYEAPTGDYNTTVGLALLSFVAYFAFGIAAKGLGYFKHYVTPKAWLMPFVIIEDISRPLSLSLRLFGNVTAGHVVIAVLLMLAPWLVPLPLMGLELFLGSVQAFIFAALSASYIGAAVAEHH
ncbi:MAG: F0F1 ATP synthase subunit A [Candidatus Sericytochromatia bacterium]|nr:F0F1 ATP synthase subunit A [Candidatus Sericytochromatia bacterium]